MNRTSWILLGLLVVTNLLWLLAGSPSATREEPPAPRDSDRQKIDALTSEVAALRRRLAERPEPQVDSPSTPGVSPDHKAEVVQSAPGATFDQRAASARAADFAEAVTQIEDEAERRAGLDAILAALGATGEEAYAGLAAFSRLWSVEFDRERFRSAVQSHLDSESAKLRRVALLAFVQLKGGADDLTRILPLARDPDAGVRQAVVIAIRSLARGGLTDPAAEAIARLMKDPDRSVAGTALDQIQSSRLPPVVVAVVLEHYRSDDWRLARSAAGRLRYLDPKSADVVDALVARIADPGGKEKQMAVLSLRAGVPSELHGRIGDALIASLPKEKDANVRAQIVSWFDRLGLPEHVDGLLRYSDNPLLDEAGRSRVLRAIESIRKR